MTCWKIKTLAILCTTAIVIAIIVSTTVLAGLGVAEGAVDIALFTVAGTTITAIIKAGDKQKEDDPK